MREPNPNLLNSASEFVLSFFLGFQTIYNVDKEKHVTRVSADVQFTYEHTETMLTEHRNTRE